jgi:predicted small lipoprotein YifL
MEMLNSRPSSHLTPLKVSAVALALLALAACGRKGPLEPPPVEASAQQPSAIVAGPSGAPQPPLQQDERVRFDDQGRPIVESVNKTPAPTPDVAGEKREFFLDPLLD